MLLEKTRSVVCLSGCGGCAAAAADGGGGDGSYVDLVMFIVFVTIVKSTIIPHPFRSSAHITRHTVGSTSHPTTGRKLQFSQY